MSRPLNRHPKGCTCAWHVFQKLSELKSERARVHPPSMCPDRRGFFFVWLPTDASPEEVPNGE